MMEIFVRKYFEVRTEELRNMYGEIRLALETMNTGMLEGYYYKLSEYLGLSDLRDEIRLIYNVGLPVGYPSDKAFSLLTELEAKLTAGQSGRVLLRGF